MIGSIEINLWPLAVFILSMVVLVANASYNESKRESEHKHDDSPS
ncbi:hypothetical protein [Maricaulis sp.]